MKSVVKKSAPKRKSRVFTVSFPEQLAEMAEQVAQKENRSMSELLRESFRAYRRERLYRVLEEARAEAEARGPIPYTEDDVERLVDEIRAERLAKEQRKKTA